MKSQPPLLADPPAPPGHALPGIESTPAQLAPYLRDLGDPHQLEAHLRRLERITAPDGRPWLDPAWRANSKWLTAPTLRRLSEHRAHTQTTATGIPRQYANMTIAAAALAIDKQDIQWLNKSASRTGQPSETSDPSDPTPIIDPAGRVNTISLLQSALRLVTAVRQKQYQKIAGPDAATLEALDLETEKAGLTRAQRLDQERANLEKDDAFQKQITANVWREFIEHLAPLKKTLATFYKTLVRELTAAGCIPPDKKAAATTIIKTNNLNLLTDLRAAAEPAPDKRNGHTVR